jgi:hypothetical protein
MGTKMAPSYANLFMSNFETNFLANQPFLPDTWLRFIDDIFIIWNHPLEEYQQFFTDLNNYNPHIKFTEEHSTKEINFLDVTIYKKDNKLCSKLFTKPTDAHLYLRYDSCHPRHNRNSIPYSQFTRLKRIHTEDTAYNHSANKLELYLKNRRYPLKLIKQSREKAESTVNNQPRDNNSKDNLIFVTKFNPRQISIKPILLKHMDILKLDPKTNFLTKKNWIVAFKRPRNIRDILVHSDLYPFKHSTPPGSHPCRKLKCLCCPFMKSTTTFQSKVTRENYTIKGNFNCQSQNIIYLLECKKCGIQYVGQTGTTMNTRFSAHRFDVKHKLNKSIPNHFMLPEHKIQDIQVTVISDASNDVTRRTLKETSWIRRLFTQEPYGLNGTE